MGKGAKENSFLDLLYGLCLPLFFVDASKETNYVSDTKGRRFDDGISPAKRIQQRRYCCLQN